MALLSGYVSSRWAAGGEVPLHGGDKSARLCKRTLGAAFRSGIELRFEPFLDINAAIASRRLNHQGCGKAARNLT